MQGEKEIFMLTSINAPAPSVIFENAKIKIMATGRDYDFIATVSNLTNYPIVITFRDDDFEPLKIAPSDWAGILADNNGRAMLKELKARRFDVDDDDEAAEDAEEFPTIWEHNGKLYTDGRTLAEELADAEPDENYDNIIDECNGRVVKVCGLEYYPSQILKEFDPLHYSLIVDDLKYAEATEYEDTLIHMKPGEEFTPIAGTVKCIRND